MKDIEDKISLTKDQIKAVGAVKRAITNARKLGVDFWNDYGDMRAFNTKVIETMPVPDSDITNAIQIHGFQHCFPSVCNINNGNADDELYFAVKDFNLYKQIKNQEEEE